MISHNTSDEEEVVGTSPVSTSPVNEKANVFREDEAHVAAERGHVVTDQ